jgi:hypothetical protein
MSLETTLTDIIARLRQGRFPNEQAVSQGIVLRVLQELGWDIYDTTSVCPKSIAGLGRPVIVETLPDKIAPQTSPVNHRRVAFRSSGESLLGLARQVKVGYDEGWQN